MHHLAILSKKLNALNMILSHEKTIESRWYKYRVAPWNKIKSGDLVYFKNAGELITVKAKVQEVIQFENLDQKEISKIARKYYKRIGFKNAASLCAYAKHKNYVILIFLSDPQELENPFNIDKTGYGNASAWICIEDIDKIKTLN